MQKLSLIAAAGLLVLPAISEAKPLDELLLDKGLVAAKDGGTDTKVSYNHGLNFSAGDDFDMQANLWMQTLYRYDDFDKSEATGRDDRGGNSLKAVRLILKGNALDDSWSYKFENDFVGDREGENGRYDNDLRDAWFQANFGDEAMLRMGQYKVPHSRQQLASDAKLQFISRSPVVNTQARGRDQGFMLHGDPGGWHYYLGIFNGESEGESFNRDPVDNNHLGAAMITADLGDYGSREEEGDWREDGDFAMTFGLSGLFGQGEVSELGDFDRGDANADIGLRYMGFSAQAEYFFISTDYDALANELEENGFYIQTGYVFLDQWEGAFRFSWYEPDSDTVAVGDMEDMQEYAFGLGYYIWGHYLKVLANITLEDRNFKGGDDLGDTRYELLVSGLI